jgi:hypothetical protein
VEGAKLFQRDRLERLGAKPRHHAHHEHHVAVGQGGRDRLEGRRRVDRQRRRGAAIANLLEHRPGVDLGLDVDRDNVGPRVDELVDERRRPRDHHVHVERQIGLATHGFDDRHAVSDVRHEVAVHHIKVQRASAGLGHGAHFGGEIAKVAQEERRQNHRRRLA